MTEAKKEINKENDREGLLSMGGYYSNKRIILFIVSFLIMVIVAIIGAVIYPERYTVTEEPVKAAMGKGILKINGNRNNDSVKFNHTQHIAFAAKENKNCTFCHHVSIPNEKQSACYKCHRDMYEVTNMFDHEYHIRLFSKGDSCNRCHKDDKSKKNRALCGSCHSEYIDLKKAYTLVRGYKDAMHGACQKCHVHKSGDINDREYCSKCHNENK